MRRRSRAGPASASVKSRRRKTATRKRRAAPKSTRHHRSPAAGVSEQVALLKRERDEALEQQRATSEILGVVARSRIDVQSVLDSVCQSAAQLCEAYDAAIWRPDGDRLLLAAHHGPIPQIDSVPMVRGSVLARAALDNRTVHILDLQTQDDEFPVTSEYARRFGFRTGLYTPLLREGVAIGVIALRRIEAKLFTERQVALLQTFADQAVIAIENARLLNELRQRTTDLTESLEQQTATSEVLKVISSSPGELEPVFNAMLENAVRICDAKFGILFRYDNEAFDPVADFGVPSALAEYLRQRRGSFRPVPGSLLDRVRQTKQVAHTADYAAEAVSSPAVPLGGARSFIAVPMLKDDSLIGAICIYRQEVRPFTDKQIALVQNFAAQAVIAIENARLLNELRQSLEQQTATADVLRVISSSPGELDPVFNAMLENATRICGANFGGMFRFENGVLRIIAKIGLPQKFFEALQSQTHRPGPLNAVSRLVRTQRPVHIADYSVDEAYLSRDPMTTIGVELGGIRTLLNVPMVKDEELVGFIGIFRQEVRPFTDKQIALVQSFAAQAVIAMENTRLLNELRQSLRQQTATADVLKVISRSTFDLQTVLDTLVESAARLCEADIAATHRLKDSLYQHAASYGLSPELHDFMKSIPFEPGRGTVAGRTVLEGKVLHIPDVQADPEYTLTSVVERIGARTMLGVPLMREGIAIGVFVLMRRTVQPFTDKQIELAETFADQAMIAIENVRLFEAEQQRSRELTESLQQQTATADVLKIISRSAFDLRAVLQTLVESAARFCAADQAAIIREKDIGFYAAEAYGYSHEFMDYIKKFQLRPSAVRRQVARYSKVEWFILPM